MKRSDSLHAATVLGKPCALSRPPMPPASLTEAGKRHWKSWTPGLCKRRALAEEDLPVLATLCLLAGEMEKLAAAFIAEGIVVRGSRGRRMQNPCYRVWRRQLPMYLLLVAQFGLSPFTRARLIARGVCKPDEPEVPAEPHDPLDDIIRRHHKTH
jgi:P27 family predicted phage terminase small subunit